MVGVCTALHLQARGHAVVLVDRKAPGRETSYGNAGLIQSEAVEPYAFPRDWRTLSEVARGRAVHAHYHAGALPALLPKLASYWRWSAPARYAGIVQAWQRLIALAQSEHAALVDAAGARDLVRPSGYLQAFRTAARMNDGQRRAERLQREHGVRIAVLDGPALAAAEPALRRPLAGAVHWLDPWSVADPGALVGRYADLFVARGGRLEQATVQHLAPTGAGWRASLGGGALDAAQVVLAAGPWADDLLAPLGLKLPLFVKRGYHRHYAGGPTLRAPLQDAEHGYVLVPTSRGTRLTTGAEFARRDAPPTPTQLGRAEPLAREIVDLPRPVESEPWLGSRPCTVDMKPVIGPAPGRPGLWLNLGHGHQGHTLGPVSGRLLAELIDGAEPCIDPAPYAATRFG